MKPNWAWLAFGTVGCGCMIVSSALWCVAPKLYVSAYRRWVPSDRLARTDEWERRMCSVSGRSAAGFLCILSCLFLWKLYAIST
jgi:drug/metabolite transporter (DMT)-like permease